MTLRVGVIGAGWVSLHRHVPSFRAHPRADVVAIYDRTEERARAGARSAGIPRAHANLDAFFDEGLDVVSICTPPWTHAELSRAAFERGCHVFTEKPMAMNQAEAAGMVAASEAASRLLCVSHNFLYSRSVRKADRMLAERKDAAVYAMGLQMSSFGRRLPDWYQMLPGGLLQDECPHMLYTLQHFLGPLELDHVRAVGKPGSEPASVEMLVRSGERSGQITMVFGTPVSEWHIALTGRGSVIDLDLFRDIVVRVGSDRAHKPLDIARSSLSALAQHAGGFVTSGARYVAKRLFWGHDVLIGRFVDAVVSGGPSPIDPAGAVNVVRLTDGILDALG